MTQIVVTLDSNADENLLRRMKENMKGVVKTSLNHSESRHQSKTGSNFIETLHEIKQSIDPSIIDLNDPRTNYIMSK